MITIVNQGPEIVGTNYWFTEHAKHGICYLSANAGTLRLLIPPRCEHALTEIQTGKTVTIERSLSQRGAWDLVFEDGTQSPFFLAVDPRMMDRGLQSGRCRLSVWTAAGKIVEFACVVRG